MSRRRRSTRKPPGLPAAPPAAGTAAQESARPLLPTDWRTDAMIAAAIFAFTLLLFVRSVTFGYVFDDHEEIERGPAAWQWSEFPTYFTGGVSGWYRPLRMASHLLEIRLLAAKPSSGHFTNTLLHAINAVLAYLVIAGLLRWLIGSRARVGAVIGALLFAAHPLQTSAVGWICGRSAVLSAVFALSSLWLICWQGRLTPGRVTGIAALFLCALLSWEGNVVLVPWAALVLFLRRKDVTRREAVLLAGGLLLALAAYFLARYLALGYMSPPKEARRIPLTHRVWQFGPVGLTYLGMIFVPFRQSADYLFPVLSSPLNPWVWGSLLGCAALLAAGLKWFARPVPLGFALVWLAAGLVPVLPLDRPFQDRYAYLPMLGLCTMAAVLWQRRSRALQTGLVLVIVVFAVLSFSRLGRWKSDQTLYAESLGHPLTSGRCYNNLGTEAESRGEMEKALEFYQKAVELEPDHNLALTNIGNYHLGKNDYKTAYEFYQRALAINDKYGKTHYNIGLCQWRLGMAKEAEDSFLKSIAMDPKNLFAYYGLGMNYEGRDNKMAIAFLNKFLALTNDSSDRDKRYRNIAQQTIKRLENTPAAPG